ncbi:putative isocitrate dehydrogenase (NADP(+)) [Helianthus annuus]|uniref:Isocitrate dehydrogenase (NADP(+)) n=1 Tax=Helianthus annuus TaxID=4232 RepID=A0A9K3DME9_HELAN|nr:putative isocitrate dehydrogenase (NADP(+)) [Helianthus annuus]
MHLTFVQKLDENLKLLDFNERLEAICICCVESGLMTKHLSFNLWTLVGLIFIFSLVNIFIFIYISKHFQNIFQAEQGAIT